MKRFLRTFLSATLAASLLVGCGESGGDKPAESTPTQAPANNDVQPADNGSDDGGSADNGGGEVDPSVSEGMKVGVSMPTKDLQRWNQDGANMEKELIAAGYEVDLQYAANDVQQQLSQIENMIAGGCDVLVIATPLAKLLTWQLSMRSRLSLMTVCS